MASTAPFLTIAHRGLSAQMEICRGQIPRRRVTRKTIRAALPFIGEGAGRPQIRRSR